MTADNEAIEVQAGGAIRISQIWNSWRDARGFKRFHPLGKWWKCPDCPDASPNRRAVLAHMDLHRAAGDYDLPEDGADDEQL